MMLIDLYVVNKVRELEAERAQRASQRSAPGLASSLLARLTEPRRGARARQDAGRVQATANSGATL